MLVRGLDGAQTVVDVADLNDFRVESARGIELFEYPWRLPHRCFRDGCDGLSELSGHREQRCERRQCLKKVAERLALLHFGIDGFDNLANGAAGREVCILNRFVDGLEPLPYGEDGVKSVGLLRRVASEVFRIVAHVWSRGVALLFLHSHRLLIT